MGSTDTHRGAGSLPAVEVLGPLRVFVARCRGGQLLLVTGIGVEHGFVLHPLIGADLDLTAGWTISEPASGCKVACGATIAATRAQLAARIEAMGGIARFLAQAQKARDAILGTPL